MLNTFHKIGKNHVAFGEVEHPLNSRIYAHMRLPEVLPTEILPA